MSGCGADVLQRKFILEAVDAFLNVFILRWGHEANKVRKRWGGRPLGVEWKDGGGRRHRGEDAEEVLFLHEVERRV